MSVQGVGGSRAGIIQGSQIGVIGGRIDTGDGQGAGGSGSRVGLEVVDHGPAVGGVFLIVGLGVVSGIDIVGAGGGRFAGVADAHNGHDQVAGGNGEAGVGDSLSGDGGASGKGFGELSREFDGRGQSGCAGTGEADDVGAAGGVVGDGDGAGASAGGGGCEGDVDGAVGGGGQGSGAGVGLGEVTAGDDTGEGEQGSAGVGERDGLGGAGGIQLLAGKSQGGGRQADGGSSGGGANASKSNGLGAAGGVVGDGDCTGLAASSGGGEGNADGAVGAGGEGSGASVGLGVRRAGGDAGDVQRRRASIGQCHCLCRAGGVHILIAEGQGGRREASSGRDSGTGEGDGLRAARCIVRDGNRAGLAANNRGCKGHAYGAVGGGGEGSGAGVGFGIRRAGHDAGDVQRSGAGIGEGDGLRRAGGVHILIAEGQGGWREADDGGRARAGEGDGLRAAGGIIGDGDGARLAARSSGCEGDVDGAVGAGGHGSAAGVGLGVRRAGGDAGDIQRRRTSVGQRHYLRRAGGIQVLIAEGQAGWREAGGGRNSGTGEVDGLRAAGGIIGDGDGARLAARSCGREGDVDGAVGTGGHGSAAGVGLGVRRAGGDAGDIQRSRTSIGQCHRLCRAGSVHVLIAEGQAGWREAGGGRDS